VTLVLLKRPLFLSRAEKTPALRKIPRCEFSRWGLLTGYGEPECCFWLSFLSKK